MQDEFTTLKETLSTVRGRGPLYYFPNPGNWGDGLIRYGALKFLYDVNLNYRELTMSRRDWRLPVFRRGTVIYGGGGGWCELWNHSLDYVTEFTQRFNVVVLPSTYESSYSIPNTTFFCRDMFESKQNMPDATFCHDMSFYIGEEFATRGKGSGKGYFFRSDAESANRIRIPSCNNDIGLKGNHLSEVSPFFDEIDRFAVVCTDRLHVAIAACLLKKEVHLYPGSYFKNRAVYLSSMKDHFEGVHFHEEPDL